MSLGLPHPSYLSESKFSPFVKINCRSFLHPVALWPLFGIPTFIIAVPFFLTLLRITSYLIIMLKWMILTLNSVWATVPNASVETISFIIATLLLLSYKRNSRGSKSLHNLHKATHEGQSTDSKPHHHAANPAINCSTKWSLPLWGNWKFLKAEANPAFLCIVFI